MKTSNYTHDFTQLEEVLLSQFEPELLAETLEQSLYAIIQHGIDNGEKSGLVMRKFDATFTLMNVFKRMKPVLHQQKSSQNSYPVKARKVA